jgi:hypothetical protein
MMLMGLMIVAVLWTTALIVWLVAGYFAVRKWGRRARIVRTVGVHAWVALALFLGLVVGKELFLDEPLARMALDGNLREVRLLLARGASPNAASDHYPAIILAASRGHTQIVRVLIEHGADVDAKDACGHTALEFARDNDYMEMAEMLEKAGARERPVPLR